MSDRAQAFSGACKAAADALNNILSPFLLPLAEFLERYSAKSGMLPPLSLDNEKKRIPIPLPEDAGWHSVVLTYDWLDTEKECVLGGIKHKRVYLLQTGQGQIIEEYEDKDIAIAAGFEYIEAHKVKNVDLSVFVYAMMKRVNDS